MRRFVKRLSFALPLLTFFLPNHLWAQAATINAGTLHQTIRGFGASSAWHGSYTAAQLDALFRVDTGIGLSMHRHRIPPDYPVNVNSGSSILQGARDRGVTQIWATCWSPPAQWKNNNNVNGDGPGTCPANPVAYLLPQYYDEYATFLADYVINMRNNNAVTLFAISPQNEPNWCPNYEASYLTGAQFQTLVRDNIGPTFQARGIGGVSIIVPEPINTGALASLADPCMNDANCRQYLLGVATHLYGTANPAPYPAAANNGKEYWETEISTFEAYDASMTHGMVTANWIHNSMANASMNAFHYWWAVSDANNEGLIHPTMGNPKRYYVMGNYSKFIRPGFRRIGATTVPQAGVSVSAYSGGTTYVIVAINGSNGALNQQFNLTGFSPSSVTPWITDASRNLAAQGAVAVSGGSFTYSLPARSVVSFIASGPAGPTATFTRTPTRTSTPIPGAFCAVDDLEDVNNVDLWGGTWSTYFGASSTVNLSVVAGGAPGSTNGSVSVSGNMADYAGVTAPLSSGGGATNISNYYAVAFMVRGNGGTYWFQVPNNAVTTGDHYGNTFTAPGSWTPVTVFFNAVTQRGWGAGQPFDLTQVTSLQWGGSANGALDFQIDDIRLLGAYCPGGPPTITPTRTATRTNTVVPPTSTLTRTATPTATLTRTNTAVPPTATSSLTATPSATSSSTPTRTNTAVPPTSTRTSTSTSTYTPVPPTATASRTSTPSATSSSTPTRTNTAVPPTSTRTSTSTSTYTAVPPTATATRTATLTSTPFAPTSTSTPTSTLSSTRTTTGTSTPSMTSSTTATATQTTSPTFTDTGAPTSTHTATRTASSTPSATSSASSTGTATASSTPSSTSTRTNSSSPTATQSATHTPTVTLTPTGTLPPTLTSTATPSSTSTLVNSPTTTASMTSTASATATRTSTLTLTATVTPSSTPTATLVNTATRTSTSTSTLTQTRTATASSTPTSTATLISTNTQTSTGTASATPTLTVTPSPSSTQTPTPTSTPTLSPTASPTLTATQVLPSPTPTVQAGSTPIVFPNPILTGTAEILPQAYTGTSDVTVSLYTSAFKLVLTKKFPSVPTGTTVKVDLADNWGQSLGNGVYYVTVTTHKNKKTTTLVILR